MFIDGVQEEFRHVVNSEMARYGELTEEQMYNAVKRHEVYFGKTKCLRGGGSTLTTPQRSTAPRTTNNTFKLHFNKTTALVAAPIEEPNSTLADSEFDTAKELTPNNMKSASEDLSSLYIPDFLWETQDGDWGLTIRMPKAIQIE